MKRGVYGEERERANKQAENGVLGWGGGGKKTKKIKENLTR